MACADRILPLLCALVAATALACTDSGDTGTDAGTEPSDPPSSLHDEAGFITIEPVSYTLHGPEGPAPRTSGAARLWYTFQPADTDPEDKPLAVLFNGGPGASSGILFGLGTARRTLDPDPGGEGAALNPASFTAFANLLYVDARGTGFSYGQLPYPSDPEARQAELALDNYNVFLDAADFVRVVLRFLAAHPEIRDRPVVLVGESYGGVRATVMLHLLLHSERYGDGSEVFEDPALAAEITEHMEAALGVAPGAMAPGRVAAQFGAQVLLQPRISHRLQDAAAGSMLDAEGSPLFALGEAVGQPFTPCAAQPQPCDGYANALEFVGSVGRDVYHFTEPSGWLFAQYDAAGARLADPQVLEAALGVDPAAIAGLPAADREGAYRLAPGAGSEDELGALLGVLPVWDRYHLMEVFDAVGPIFAGPEAEALGIDRLDPRYGAMFLDNLIHVDTFITRAALDIVLYAPALPQALAMISDQVITAEVDDSPRAGEERPGWLTLRFADQSSRVIRFPRYDAAGHTVTLTQPLELSRDVGAWLGARALAEPAMD